MSKSSFLVIQTSIAIFQFFRVRNGRDIMPRDFEKYDFETYCKKGNEKKKSEFNSKLLN